ncbi:hypothetical protein ALC60_02196 [Trachymyrmex zeteki]|uniref:Uncharacterized protein n=1 Tax=Mycetomoellerius zeteki TaxID=64791 RepID=A0A151XDV3_9HYME|nr:hypothetical protein ALC60_02196 [Trachymyrmex zeteki]
MRVRRGFLPQPPQGAPWRLAAVREDDIAHRRGHGGSSGGRRRAVPSGTGSLIFGGLRQGIDPCLRISHILLPSTGCRTRSRSGDPTMPGIQEGTRSLDWILVANLRAIEFASYSLITSRVPTLCRQSHATVIPRHIQEQRVKQDWSFSL